jgi:hypothetical protein
MRQYLAEHLANDLVPSWVQEGKAQSAREEIAHVLLMVGLFPDDWLNAYRAEVLRKAADIAESLRQFERCTGARRSAQTSENVGILRVADQLRRMADEATPKQPAPADLTIYRASHDSIVMGLYTTAAEARKHCETLVRREYGETSKVHLWWREDEDTVDQPEDGEQELYIGRATSSRR